MFQNTGTEEGVKYRDAGVKIRTAHALMAETMSLRELIPTLTTSKGKEVQRKY